MVNCKHQSQSRRLGERPLCRRNIHKDVQGRHKFFTNTDKEHVHVVPVSGSGSVSGASLTNKTPGEHGRDLYLREQREILGGKVHLVEIDLLRAGEHTTAVPRHRLARMAGEFEYHVSIHHFDNLKDYFVYPIRINEALPQIAVPLLPGDPPVPLDLQAVFLRTYDAGPYRREIDYQHDTPVPPLPPALQT